MKWQKVLLGNLVDEGSLDILTGPFGTQLKASDYTKIGTPVINVRNIGYGDLKPEKLEYVPEPVVQKLERHILQKGDIVFARKGAVDRHLLVEESQSGWMQGSDCIRIRLSSRKVSHKFLSYSLRLESHKSWILNQCGNKATMASLNQDVIRRVIVRLPNIDIQQEIVNILSKYDDLIENNRRRIQLLERSLHLLYKEWFVHLRFPSHEHSKIVDGIPEGWEKVRLCEVADTSMGQSPPSESYNDNGIGLPFHQGVTNFGSRFPENKTYCTIESRIAEPNDILFSVRAPVGRINITLDKIIIGRGLAAIRSKFSQQNFLFYQLKSHFFKEDMIGGGAIFAAITKKDLHNVELVQPTHQLVQMFTEYVTPIDRQLENLYKANIKLQQARDLLLPKLMSGAISV